MEAEEKAARFHKYVWAWRADVLRAARMMVRDGAEADDLAQETLIKAYQGIEGFFPGTNAKAWLMTILRRTRIDRLRAGKRHEGISLEGAEMDVADRAGSEEVEFGGDVEGLLEQFSDGEMIGALQELPEEIRWTLLLVEVQGMSLEEAGVILGVPTGTVKSRCFRGKGNLRGVLTSVFRGRKKG